MQLRIIGRGGLKKALARYALHWYARTLLPKNILKRVRVMLFFTNSVAYMDGAEMWPGKGRLTYFIRCNSRSGPYRTLSDLAHEMIHVQQYATGVMTEKKAGTCWRGKVHPYNDKKEDATYWNAPWEIDAYGRAYYLYKRCRLHMLKRGFKFRRYLSAKH